MWTTLGGSATATYATSKPVPASCVSPTTKVPSADQPVTLKDTFSRSDCREPLPETGWIQTVDPAQPPTLEADTASRVPSGESATLRSLGADANVARVIWARCRSMTQTSALAPAASERTAASVRPSVRSRRAP